MNGAQKVQSFTRHKFLSRSSTRRETDLVSVEFNITDRRSLVAGLGPVARPSVRRSELSGDTLG